MTQDIIEMARQVYGDTVWSEASLDRLKRFYNLVAAKEREACARLCEGGIIKGGEVFAAKIRARGNT